MLCDHSHMPLYHSNKKINKRKRKILVFKYTIIYIRAESFILFSLVKLKRITTLCFYFFDI